MAKYVACICEGGAERAIIDLLLDHHKLIFERTDLIDEEVLRCRCARDFEKNHLKKGFSEKIVRQYFSNIEVLIHALHEYRRVSKIHKNEKTLWDLLR